MMTPAQALTARELEMVTLLCDGVATDKDLSERLAIAPATVYAHMASIFKKYGVHNRVELVVTIYKAKLAALENIAPL